MESSGVGEVARAAIIADKGRVEGGARDVGISVGHESIIVQLSGEVRKRNDSKSARLLLGPRVKSTSRVASLVSLALASRAVRTQSGAFFVLFLWVQ